MESEDNSRLLDAVDGSDDDDNRRSPRPVHQGSLIKRIIQEFKQRPHAPPLLESITKSRLGWFFLGLLLVVLGSYVVWNTTFRERHDKCWCGSTVADAVSMGCVYDDIAGDWLQERCVDKELLAEFRRAGPGPDGAWDYYEDRHGKTKINVTDMAGYTQAFGSYFGTRRWHASHCLYTWRKQFRGARMGGSYVEPYDDTEEHIKHCTMILLSQLDSPSAVEWLVPGKRDPITHQ